MRGEQLVQPRRCLCIPDPAHGLRDERVPAEPQPVAAQLRHGPGRAEDREPFAGPGLQARLVDRGDPVVQLAPPLTCGPAQFDEIEEILRGVLTDAWARL